MSVAEDYVAFVVDVGKRRGERSVTKSLPEPWYGLCVFTELSINRDYFRILHWVLFISETELLTVRCDPILHLVVTNLYLKLFCILYVQVAPFEKITLMWFTKHNQLQGYVSY